MSHLFLSPVNSSELRQSYGTPSGLKWGGHVRTPVHHVGMMWRRRWLIHSSIFSVYNFRLKILSSFDSIYHRLV